MDEHATAAEDTPPPPAPDRVPTDRVPTDRERLRRLPVPVVVRLAERKITLDALRKVAPGSLITFSKSCEDLLDLYVNNRLLARGEAVKIGEKFGLKVNRVERGS